ncbi:hypothetical protein PN4B1_47970 [Paenibacillus naphthalenovorans]|nr:hypothetical protein PN4B1_47970 [Paenibacillus naphthalenovorans]
MYEIFGSDNGFCEWKVKAKGFVLYWNDFVSDAWFVNWNKPYIKHGFEYKEHIFQRAGCLKYKGNRLFA